MSLHPVKGGIILSLLAAAAICMVPSHTYDVPKTSELQAAERLYRNSERTQLSTTSWELFRGTVSKRLACYREHGFWVDRIQTCNYAYVSGIIDSARKRIRAMPAVGIFVREVRNCPEVYAIAMAKTSGDKEKSMDMELRCIDYNLDLYWRGINLYRYPLRSDD